MTTLEPENVGIRCGTPHTDTERITLAHGEGARLTRRLIRNELLPLLGNELLDTLADGATLPAPQCQVVVTTDSSVVSPLVFPGGDIGKLAVNGAVNDLAVCGAVPEYLTLAMILEEGLPLATLRQVVASIAQAAKVAGVRVVTGDTKVVPHGAVDALFLCTTGIGRRRPGVELGPQRVQVGDRILVSGTIADHGLAVLAARNQLGFAGLASDTAPVHELVAELLDSGVDVHFLRDPTRGGVSAVLHELLEYGLWEFRLWESALPLSAGVRGACELLGLDPLHVANEGKVLAIVSANDADRALAVFRQHPLGAFAACIGEVCEAAKPRVVVRGGLGVDRALTEPNGAPLPRIC